MPKVAPIARPQGQRQGQKLLAALAAQHGVSARWLRLIAYGSLDDPAFIQAIREAAKTPALWELVSPAAQDALVIPMSKMTRLGGSLDDLLAGLLDSLALLRHPINQNFARHTTALEHVNQSLDLHLEARTQADADRGRRSLEDRETATKAAQAKAEKRAREWMREVDARKYVSEAFIHQRIGKREGLTGDAVKKAIHRLRKKQRST